MSFSRSALHTKYTMTLRAYTAYISMPGDGANASSTAEFKKNFAQSFNCCRQSGNDLPIIFRRSAAHLLGDLLRAFAARSPPLAPCSEASGRPASDRGKILGSLGGVGVLAAVV